MPDSDGAQTLPPSYSDTRPEDQVSLTLEYLGIVRLVSRLHRPSLVRQGRPRTRVVLGPVPSLRLVVRSSDPLI